MNHESVRLERLGRRGRGQVPSDLVRKQRAMRCESGHTGFRMDVDRPDVSQRAQSLGEQRPGVVVRILV